MNRPYLLLDVDGVLALGARRGRNLSRHEVVASNGQAHTIWFNNDLGHWLRTLAARFDLVWATGWEHDAPRLMGPLLNLPEMHVIEFTQRPELGVPLDKLPDVMSYVGEAPAAWVDDEIAEWERAWAKGRSAPTLLLKPDPTLGMRMEHVNRLLDFADGQKRVTPG